MKDKKKGIYLIIVASLITLVFILIGVHEVNKEIDEIKASKFDINESKINLMATKDDILFNDKKNIYFFWGKGCNHCKKESYYLNKLYPKIKDKVNIYGFEVWNNIDNRNLFNDLTRFMDSNEIAVPFTVIGNKSILGFSPKIYKEIEKNINIEIDNTNYIDIIKKMEEEKDEK